MEKLYFVSERVKNLLPTTCLNTREKKTEDGFVTGTRREQRFRTFVLWLFIKISRPSSVHPTIHSSINSSMRQSLSSNPNINLPNFIQTMFQSTLGFSVFADSNCLFIQPGLLAFSVWLFHGQLQRVLGTPFQLLALDLPTFFKVLFAKSI